MDVNNRGVFYCSLKVFLYREVFVKQVLFIKEHQDCLWSEAARSCDPIKVVLLESFFKLWCCVLQFQTDRYFICYLMLQLLWTTIPNRLSTWRWEDGGFSGHWVQCCVQERTLTTSCNAGDHHSWFKDLLSSVDELAVIAKNYWVFQGVWINCRRNIESHIESMQQEPLRNCAQRLTNKNQSKRNAFCQTRSRTVWNWLVCLKGYLCVNNSFEVCTNFPLVVKEPGLD